MFCSGRQRVDRHSRSCSQPLTLNPSRFIGMSSYTPSHSYLTRSAAHRNIRPPQPEVAQKQGSVRAVSDKGDDANAGRSNPSEILERAIEEGSGGADVRPDTLAGLESKPMSLPNSSSEEVYDVEVVLNSASDVLVEVRPCFLPVVMT